MKQTTTIRRGALVIMALAGMFAGALHAQTGNVGIGTTTPGSTLSVNGSLSLAHNAITANSFSLGDNDYYVAWNGNASGSAMLPAGGTSLKGRSYIVKNASTGFTLSIYPAGSGERIDGNAAVVLAPGEVATIIMNGLVPGTSGSPASTAGIAAVTTGTTAAGAAPAKAWTSRGNRGSDPATDFIGTADATDFVAKTSNVERMRIQSGGNVGIGVANPTEALHVGGAVRVNNLPAAGGTNMVTVDNDGVLRKQALPTASAPTIQGMLTTGVNLTASNWLGWNYTGASITIPANSKYVIFGTFYIAASVAPTSTQALTLRVSISDNNATFTRSADIAGAYYITGTLPPIASTTTITGNIVVHNTSNAAKTYYLFAGSAGVWGSYSTTINNFGASTATYFENGVFALPIN